MGQLLYLSKLNDVEVDVVLTFLKFAGGPSFCIFHKLIFEYLTKKADKMMVGEILC